MERRGLRRLTAAGEQPAGDNVRAPTQATVGQEYSYQAQATDEDGDPLFGCSQRMKTRPPDDQRQYG